MGEGNDSVSLDLMIRVLADTYGADRINEALAGVRGNASKAGEGMGDLKKNTEEFNVHGREMRLIFRQLDHLIPGLGHIMKSLFDPKDMGLVVMLLVLEQVNEKLKEYKEHLAEIKKYHADLAEAPWNASLEAVSKLREDAAKFAEEMSKVPNALDKMTEKEKQALEILNAQIEALAKIAENQGDSKRAEYIRGPEGRALREQLLEQQIRQASGESFDAATRLAAANKLRAGGTGMEGQAAEAQVTLEHANSEAQKARERFDQISAHTNGMTPEQLRAKSAQFEATDMNYARALLSQANELEKATKKLDEVHHAQETAKAVIDKENEAHAKLETAVSRAQEEVNKWQAHLQELNQKLDAAKTVGAGQQAADDAVALAKAGLKPGSVLGQTLLGDIRAEEAFAHGDKLSSAQQIGIQQLIQSFRAMHLTQQQQNDLFKMMHDLHMDTSEKLRLLLESLHQVKQQTANQPAATPGSMP